MDDLVLTDETLDINLTFTYHLLIQTGLNGLSYCILDSTRNKYIALKHFCFDKKVSGDNVHNEIKKILDTEEYLRKKYKSARLIYISEKSTLVPAALFNVENSIKYFKFNHNINSSDKILYNKLMNAGSFNIFSLPENIIRFLNEHIPGIRYFHQATPFIENSLINFKVKKKQNRYVNINVSNSFFDIVVIGNEGLILYNSFSWSNEEDFTYFIMYIYEHLKLNPEEVQLSFSGNITKGSALYDHIKQFVRNISFTKRNRNFIYSYTLSDIPHHSYTNLLSLPVCE